MSAEKTESVFNKIGIAIAFSPRIEAIVAEAAHLQKVFNAHIVFIHIGKQTAEQENYLLQLINNKNIASANYQIIWKDGDTVDTILNICDEEAIDLLVAGALEKENLIKYFMGSVARKLSRRVKCSMLMLTEPSENPANIKHIVVEGADHVKTKNTIAVAFEYAKAYNAQTVDIIQETDLTKAALIRSDEFKENETAQHKELLIKEEDQKLDYILSCNDCGNIKINTERIEGKPGYVISKYAREHEADLLILNSPDRKLNLIDRVFPNDIEFALADLPCNLLLVNVKED